MTSEMAMRMGSKSKLSGLNKWGGLNRVSFHFGLNTD